MGIGEIAVWHCAVSFGDEQAERSVVGCDGLGGVFGNTDVRRVSLTCFLIRFLVQMYDRKDGQI